MLSHFFRVARSLRATPGLRPQPARSQVTVRQPMPALAQARKPTGSCCSHEALRGKARPQLRDPTPIDTTHDPYGAIPTQDRAVCAVSTKLHVEVDLLRAGTDGTTEIPGAMVPFAPCPSVKVLQVGFRALPYRHTDPGQTIMRKMERLRQRGSLTCIERREMPIEHPYRSRNRLWMIESRRLHLLSR